MKMQDYYQEEILSYADDRFNFPLKMQFYLCTGE
jgi:hypothetical protein